MALATIQTERWVSTAPYVKLTVTEASSTNTTYTVNWTLQYISDTAANTSSVRNYTVFVGSGSSTKEGTYDIDGKTGTNTIASGTKSFSKTNSKQTISLQILFAFNLTWSGEYVSTLGATGSFTVPATTAYVVQYEANGGTGAPGNQIKYHDVNLTLSSTKPTETNHTFQGWGTSSTDTTVDYNPGDTYSNNASITLYAIWKANTYTVSYDANGGTGAPGNQTKTYGKTLTLSSTKPTKADYTFLGWGTSASATSVAYAPGALYTANKALKLYAIWELTYKNPTITKLTVSRCDSDGTANDSGTYARVTFEWTTLYTVTSVKIEWGTSGSSTVTATGNSGSVDTIVGDGAFDPETTYTIKATVADSGNSFSYSKTLSSVKYPIDFKAGGTGVAFGKASELDNVAEFAFDAKFNGPVYGKALGMDRLPAIPNDSDLDTYLEPGCYSVQRNDTSETIANIPVQRAGRLEVWSATGEGIRQEQWSYLRQRYIPYNIENPTFERDATRGEDNVWNFTDWIRTSLSKGQTGMVYFRGAALWTGAYYMTEGHTIALSHAISAQRCGIVLVFSKYSSSAAQDNNFNSFFISKEYVASHLGMGSAFTMMDINFGQVCHKYLYINDATITGHANNSATGTGASGIKYLNNAYVLRAVYGV